MFQQFYEGRNFWVIADVTDHKYYANKDHHYLALVEKKTGSNEIVSKISATIWKEGSARIRFFEEHTGQKFQNNINVLVKVNVNYKSAYGLKLTITDISTDFTLGMLERHKQETLQRLLTECSAHIYKSGNEYISTNKELSFKPVIQRIAVLTSSSSAGYQDFQHTLDKNNFGYRFEVEKYFTTVQGEASTGEICRMLDEIAAGKRSFDAIVIIRGGGAQVDFLVFDNFEICSRIARLPYPVITGIGHHKDETITDMLAKNPTKTPTKAAEFIIAHNRSFEEAMLALRNNMIIKVQSMMSDHNKQIGKFNSSIVNKVKDMIAHQKDMHAMFNRVVVNQSREFILHKRSELISLGNSVVTKPRISMAARRNELDHMVNNLRIFARKYFVNMHGYLGYHDAVCKMMHPKNILEKGFAIIYQDNRIIASGENIDMKKEIKVRMHDASIIARPGTKNKIDGKEPDL